MPATTTLLGLVTPTQGTLSGTWGDTVNYGITDYVDIAIAGTLSFAGDGAITLANTLGSASGNGITSTTAQYMVIRVTGTLTTPKIITAPSYSKLYMVDNAATGSTVSFIRSGQVTAVSVAVGEKAFVYYNGTDYVKIASSVGTGDVVGPASATANGIALFNSTTGKLIKDSAASDGLIYGLTVGRGGGAVLGNTTVGQGALAGSNSGAGGNVAFGYNAAAANTTGASNTALGTSSFLVNTTGSNNTAVGQDSLRANTTASSSTAVGYQSGYNSTGSANALFGAYAGYNTTSGTQNTYIGTLAGPSSGSASTGSYNVALGYQSLQTNTTASNNTAVGYQVGYSNTTGAFNTWVGGLEQNNSNATGRNNTTGNFNTALGNGASALTTTGSNNTVVGYQAGYTPTTANENTFVGFKAGFVKTTGDANTFIGNQSGVAATTGITNTFLGASSGSSVTTGSKNTILGSYNGNQGSLDIRTLSNYIVLSDGDGNPRFYSDPNGVLYDINGKLRAIPQSGSAKTSSYTLATTDVGEYIQVGASGSITIPDATFATGDVVSIFNNTSGGITITCSITTAYIGGTDADKATITLATRGVATVLFISGTVCVVNGNVS
jgi:hypothetical protein